MIIARRHRGGLDESMETKVTFDKLSDMLIYFDDECKAVMPNSFVYVDGKVFYDRRTGWNTRYILCRHNVSNLEFVIGMCDLDWSEEDEL